MNIDLEKLKSNLNEYDRYQAAWYMWPDNLSASPEDLLALIEVAEAARKFKKLIDTSAMPTLDNLVINRNYYAEDIIASVLSDIEAGSATLEAALAPFKETP